MSFDLQTEEEQIARRARENQRGGPAAPARRPAATATPGGGGLGAAAWDGSEPLSDPLESDSAALDEAAAFAPRCPNRACQERERELVKELNETRQVLNEVLNGENPGERGRGNGGTSPPRPAGPSSDVQARELQLTRDKLARCQAEIEEKDQLLCFLQFKDAPPGTAAQNEHVAASWGIRMRGGRPANN